MNKELGLYIHIPFCKSKCYYCDFNSFACRDDFVPAYFNALKSEITLYADVLRDYRIKTVFFGGGTPSLVDAQYINKVMLMLSKCYTIDGNAEITIEANPGTLSYDKLAAYRSMGINRLSMGLQAAQERLLKILGRIHSLEEFYNNYNQAKKAGFDNINVDLIFGIPGQDFMEWSDTIDYVCDLKPSHVSCYSLKIEEGTAFGKMLESGELIEMNDADDRLMYRHALESMHNKGYGHYELSNFAYKGLECRHNLIYWNNDEYIGMGAGAHSFINNERFNNFCGLKEYVESLSKGTFARENVILVTEKDRMAEFMFLGLRLTKGININEFDARFGKSIFSVFEKEINKVIKRGLAEFDSNHLKLTVLGLDLANQVFMEFV
ncbi:MAG: oxygen-independent coproporphyrinogen III oxidase [Clostridiaceae bacterium]|nr:oxygen-independent coproporphyrinogen III oxidase [Clostridiaceae bacterium]